MRIFAEKYPGMFIHESPAWPNFSWDTAKISALEKTAMLRLGYLCGRMSAIGFDNRLSAMVEKVTNDVVASSSIEGIKLDTEEVRSSIGRKLGVNVPKSKDSTHYVDGIVEMMLDALKNHSSPLTEKRLSGWHHALFPTGYSGSYELNVGKYRDEEMSVVSGVFGRERVHYRAPHPDKVKPEMDRFLEWLNTPDVNSPLLKAGIAHLWFVSIHPFDDGNGRIARAISDMILASLEGDELHYYSLSRQILKDRKHYYDALERTQRGNCDITLWLEWFLNAVIEAIADSNAMLSQVLRKATFWANHSESSISSRQRSVLNVYLDGYDAKLTAKNWARLAGTSTDTALRDIASLAKQHILIPTPGKVRDIAYSINYSRPDDNPENLFTDIRLDGDYITATYRDGQELRDKVLATDLLRLSAGEIDLQSLAHKYFAYLLNQ